MNDIDDLGFEDEGNDRSARHGEPASVGPWFVRFAGRRSGPFDAERLRTLARRGALTRMHSVSADGKAWVPATSVRAVFNADGSVVASGARAVEVAEDDRPDFDGIPDAPLELPRAMARAALGSALVRPVVLCALVLATVMLAMPTSRDESGARNAITHPPRTATAHRPRTVMSAAPSDHHHASAPDSSREVGMASMTVASTNAYSTTGRTLSLIHI